MSGAPRNIRPHDMPPAEYAFGYRRPPRSGNAINGLGEPVPRRATHVFHNPGNATLEWHALNDFFTFLNPWPVVRHLLGNLWLIREREGPVAARRLPVDAAEVSAEALKAKAREFGADLVGITQVTDTDVVEGHAVPHRTAIMIGMRMDRDAMQHVPHEPAAVEVLRVYKEISRTAMKLARHVRALGWPAKGYGDANSTDILHIPLAIRAGLGELGKHGSIISDELGSNFRLAAVLTDLPLPPDAPRTFGVDDVCASCQRCVSDCPPGAITNAKQTVRGVEKWYVDFDRCVPYFVKTWGCAICIEVCPWSVPGQGPRLAQTMLARRARQGGAAADGD